jgi:hypothetical protein
MELHAFSIDQYSPRFAVLIDDHDVDRQLHAGALRVLSKFFLTVSAAD